MAPSDLTGTQRQRLRLVLVQAFPGWNELRRLVSDQLDVNLATITSQSTSLEDNVFDLIDWARARGQLMALLIAARNQNPDNPQVQDFASMIGLSSTPTLQRLELEEIVRGNTVFLDVAKWRAELTHMESRVCRIDQDGAGRGTGFLVAPDLVLTNYHVIEPLIGNGADASRWSCRFDFRLGETGDVISAGSDFKLASDWLVDVMNATFALKYSTGKSLTRMSPSA